MMRGAAVPAVLAICPAGQDRRFRDAARSQSDRLWNSPRSCNVLGIAAAGVLYMDHITVERLETSPRPQEAETPEPAAEAAAEPLRTNPAPSWAGTGIFLLL